MKRGFTLIELLVVIAIIGILSAVVLASLDTARAKGNDAAIKGDLDSARAQAELFYDSNGQSYYGGTAATDVCNTSGVANGVRGIYQNVSAAATVGGSTYQEDLAGGVGKTTCNATASGWAVESPLKTNSTLFWCTDSTGKSLQETASSLTTASTITCT